MRTHEIALLLHGNRVAVFADKLESFCNSVGVHPFLKRHLPDGGKAIALLVDPRFNEMLIAYRLILKKVQFSFAESHKFVSL